MAVLCNHPTTAGILLSMRADPSNHLADGRNVVHIAAEYGFTTVLETLVGHVPLSLLTESSPASQLTPLESALVLGHVAVVEKLVEAGAADHTWNDKGYNCSLFLLAARNISNDVSNTIKMIDCLLRAGVSLEQVNHNNETPFFELSRKTYLPVLQHLLTHATPPCLQVVNFHSRTCVTDAVESGNYETALALVAAGASLHPTPEAEKVMQQKSEIVNRGWRTAPCPGVLYLAVQRGKVSREQIDFVDIVRIS